MTQRNVPYKSQSTAKLWSGGPRKITIQNILYRTKCRDNILERKKNKIAANSTEIRFDVALKRNTGEEDTRPE